VNDIDYDRSLAMGIERENSWSLISQGKFLEAYNKATDEYNETGSLISLRHRAKASLLLEDYCTALADFQEVLYWTEELYRGDTDYINIGMVYWLLNDHDQATKYWLDSMTLKLRTGNIVIPPSIVYFAGVYLKDSKLIKEACKYLKRRWKGSIPLAGFLLDHNNEDDLLSTIEPDSPMEPRTLCKYEFYIASKYLQKENMEGYLEHLKKCIQAKGNYLEFEYYIAVGELHKIS
jgi:tetratricopeptide (TPR) repeat protein